ncbi:hypothetical protein FHS37_007452 [Streptomyces griseostramineus]|uniref:Uncharacterized protein n=1 Tax=Streptomyces griseomycini TaxID=66895 RepID=A0A7W7PY12_9ACTN|nr:hypothetical protein [Streptomyces griseomycini]
MDGELVMPAHERLDPAWGAAGVEGTMVKALEQLCLPGKRAWVKVRNRTHCIGCNSS